MELKQGLKFYNFTSASTNDILSISSGTRLVESDKYHASSYLPGPFRELNTTELEVLMGEESELADGLKKAIAVFEAPNSLLSIIRNSDVCEFESVEQFYGHLRNHPKLMGKIEMELQEFVHPLQITENKRFLGFAISEPLISTGFNVESGKFFGLHFDNSGYPCFANLDRPNRILVNCGKSSRHLYYMNLDISQLMTRYGTDFKSERELSTTFFEQHPKYPVIRIRLDPGQGYLAPTDNIIHDGNSSSVEQKDIFFSILGDFDVSRLPVLSEARDFSQ